MQQAAALLEQIDDQRVRVPHLLAREVLDLRGQETALVHRAVDVEAIFHPREVVVPAVTGGGVDDTGAGVEGDVVGQHAG
jgi:hypothetical protein